MDIFTHTASGLAAGAVVAGFTKRRPAAQVGIIALSGLGGALPDLDVISLWSRFDATFGLFFGLALPGTEIYPAHLWYSHHGFMHSMAAALLIALLFAASGWLWSRLLVSGKVPKGFRTNDRAPKSFRESLQSPALLGFVLGFWLHLVEDMLTPGSSWGGVRLLWPLKTYVGGWGKIWWWNNYDLFLIVSGTLAACVTVLIVRRQRRMRVLLIGLFALGIMLFSIQVAERDANYAYTRRTAQTPNFEAESRRQQRETLPSWLYRTMSWVDDHVPVSF